ncbi:MULTISPECIES: DUF6265 family protein [unclassified Flavobacterium]|uniref:DUF6265 family protein n=1 Tax=unclassified Flavobacterium TaxID=196869 RepID=UPI001F134C0D|nr:MULTISPECIES: DUF6265 family protein [unclassified Flavobacterium]UMY65482.1 DUF6265 family protein [Flavobacterium sp. HJ-32-4]
MRFLLPIVALTVLFSACGKKEASVPPAEKPSRKATSLLNAASWMEGRWENQSKDGVLSEIWQKESDSLFKGASYFVAGNDTLFAESVDLVLTRDGYLDYIVSVPGQNNEKPVAFRRTSGTETQMVFENPQHDYPTRIVYERRPGDSLVATISGHKNGKTAAEVFRLKKVK